MKRKLNQRVAVIFLSIIGILSIGLTFPLHAAEVHDHAKAGNLSKLKTLVELDAKLVNSKDAGGRTPLHWACRGVHLEVVKCLLQKGANPNILDGNQIAPLHSVAVRGHEGAAALLMEKGATVDIRDYDKMTPLHYAAMFGRSGMIRLLIEKGANVEAMNSRNRTPLIILSRESGKTEGAAILLDKGANIDAVDKYNESPLILAAWRGYKPLVNLLLKKDAQLPATAKKKKQLLLHSVTKGLTDLFSILVQKGADINVVNENDGSLLHSAAKGGAVEIVALLLKQKLEIGKKDRLGWTALHYAAYGGHKNVVELLIKKGISIDSRNKMGMTAFNMAGEAGHKEIVAILTAKGASQEPPKFPKLTGKYLGQKKPGNTPERFANGIVSAHRNLHGCIVFSPDGKEAVWSPNYEVPGQGSTMSKLMSMREGTNGWETPAIIPFTDKYGGDVPFYSLDGKKLFFLSRRPISGKGPMGRQQIWYVEKKNNRWIDPVCIDRTVNDMDLHWQFSLDKDNNLYFGSSSAGGKGQNDVYISTYKDGKYTKPVNLGDAVNTAGAEFSPFISSDGSYLLFSRVPEGKPDVDLFVSFRKKDGTWAKAVNLGDPVNTSEQEVCPIVSPDGKYLFYISLGEKRSGVYWVNADVFHKLKR